MMCTMQLVVRSNIIHEATPSRAHLQRKAVEEAPRMHLMRKGASRSSLVGSSSNSCSCNHSAMIIQLMHASPI